MSKIAKYLDMFRIFPRMVLVVYTVGLIMSVNWYISYKEVPEIKCDAAVMQVVLNKGESIKTAELLACRQVGVIGRPVGYTALIPTMFGAGAVFFGFYTNSGWKWKVEADKDQE